MDDMLMLTVMFSDKGLEAFKRADMYLVLEAEGFCVILRQKHPLQANRTQDDVGNNVWAINIMLANAKGIYGELLVELNSYK